MLPPPLGVPGPRGFRGEEEMVGTAVQHSLAELVFEKFLECELAPSPVRLDSSGFGPMLLAREDHA
jgi:hypothetical protein